MVLPPGPRGTPTALGELLGELLGEWLGELLGELWGELYGYKVGEMTVNDSWLVISLGPPNDGETHILMIEGTKLFIKVEWRLGGGWISSLPTSNS